MKKEGVAWMEAAPLMSRAKESAQYAKCMQSKVTLQKSIDIEKVGVTSNDQYN